MRKRKNLAVSFKTQVIKKYLRKLLILRELSKYWMYFIFKWFKSNILRFDNSYKYRNIVLCFNLTIHSQESENILKNISVLVICEMRKYASEYDICNVISSTTYNIILYVVEDISYNIYTIWKEEID